LGGTQVFLLVSRPATLGANKTGLVYQQHITFEILLQFFFEFAQLFAISTHTQLPANSLE
jgi:hypothetical protein